MQHLDKALSSLEPDVPPYQGIVNVLAVQIEAGSRLPGSKLPSVRALAEKLGIANETVRKAYAMLQELGYTKARWDGTFVAKSSAVRSARLMHARAELRRALNRLRSRGITQSEIDTILADMIGER